MCLWDAFLWEPAPALGFAWMHRMDIAYMQTSFGFASQLRALGLHSCCHNAAGTEAQMHLRFAFSAISEDPLHIGNYKLAANYGCFRADQRIHFYNVCFSAACCGGNVHLWETAWLPGVIRLQGMEIAHVQISFVVDVVCLQASFVCFDFRACCYYAWDLEIRQMLLWFASPTYAGRHAAHWKPQAWCQRWLQGKQLINALWLFEVTFDCTSLLLVEAGMLTTGTFLSCHKEGTKA